MVVQHNTRTRPANSTQGPDRQSPCTNPAQEPGPQPSSTIPVDTHIFHFSCITSRDVTAIHDMLRGIAARLHNETEPSSSIPGPDPQPSPTTPDHRHDFHLCKFTTCKGKELFEVPVIEDIMHVSIEMHVSSASPDWQTVQSRRRQRNFPSEIISCPMPEAGLNTPSSSTEAGQGMVQLLIGADDGFSVLNEDDFFPQTVQGPRREAELALSRAITKEIWRTVRLSRPRDSASLRLREWENKKVLVWEVIWHKFARRIDSSHKRTWNEWLKEWEYYFRQENNKVWQGQRRLDRGSRWQAIDVRA